MKPKGQFSFNPEDLEFHSSCASGLHEFLLKEVSSFNLKVLSYNRGGVHFKGLKENLYNFFLSTRFSSRISFVFCRANVKDADELYQVTRKLAWEKLILKDLSFKIESFTKENLNHSRFALYRLKDAIKDRIREQQNYEAQINSQTPDVLILLRSNQKEAIVQISLSPLPLHKRGYRQNSLEAPLRESLAQALLEFSDWKPFQTLVDPMCGSGTILIEAALLEKWDGKINYQILKDSYIFQKFFDKISKVPTKVPSSIHLFGYDKDYKAIQLAKENAKKAGVEDWIYFKQEDFTHLKPSFPKGYLVTNPPYGVRLKTNESLEELYFQIGKNLKNSFSGFIFTLVCGNKSLLGHLRLKASKELSITIAKLKGKFVQYKIQ